MKARRTLLARLLDRQELRLAGACDLAAGNAMLPARHGQQPPLGRSLGRGGMLSKLALANATARAVSRTLGNW